MTRRRKIATRSYIHSFILLLALTPLAAGAEELSRAKVSDQVLGEILDAGKWGPNASEFPEPPEQLASATVKRVVENYRAAEAQLRGDISKGTPEQQQAIAELGLLALTMGTAKWGIKFGANEMAPDDPAKSNWEGPASAKVGKHLLSRSIGGIGLPHLDVGSLARFLDYIVQSSPKLGPPEELAVIKQLASRFRSGLTYDKLRNRRDSQWEVFQKWMQAALLTRESQRWILEDWLTSDWFAAYKAVRAHGGSAEEALINVRIRNSGAGAAKCALQKANAAEARAKANGATIDRVQVELEAYAEGCPRSDKRFKTDRWGYMMRPVAVLRFCREHVNACVAGR